MPRREAKSTAGIVNDEPMTYYLMSADDALNEMENIIRGVNEILGLPSNTLARLILNLFQWDKEKLTERFFDNSDEVFRKLDIANPNLSPSVQWNPLSPAYVPLRDPLLTTAADTSKELVCRNCCMEKPRAEFLILPCRHQHCVSCWKIYLESTIRQNDCGKCISCPSRCNQIVDDEQILKLIEHDDQLRQLYRRYLVDTFVEANRLTRWCPGVNCSTIVKLKSYSRNNAYLIICDTCNFNFCFECTQQWHEPIQCTLLKKWNIKNQDESMTGKWILGNTKECPKCHTSIEKNGGCNHMTCRKPGCGHEFCWLCFSDWNGHQTQQCNVYQQGDNEKKQSEARETLARYMHYFTRYQVHNQSLELESQLAEQVVQRVREMEEAGMSYTDRQALPEAFQVLKKCRRALKYTYPFAYYLKRDHHTEIFEQNQADLADATEKLSGFLEQDVDANNNIATTLRDRTAYCDKRATKLLEHCKEGYQKKVWQGLDDD